MNSLFGVELPTPVNFVIAFVVVLALIGAATWLVRRFGAARIEANVRGRQPRLAVIDSAVVDGRRRLVIIRRDNVEHLLMIGGPTDVVVETNIVRAAPSAMREPTLGRNGGAEAGPRVMPLPEPSPWPLPPEPSPALAPTLRAERGPRVATDDAWQPPPEPAPMPRVGAARPSEPPPAPVPYYGRVADYPRPAPESIGPRPLPSEPAPIVPPMPQPAAAAQAGAPAIAAPDQSLAEMAQRLEAALRRPQAQRAGAEASPRPAAANESKPAARPEPRIAVAASKGGAQPKPQPSNIEQEMANLLSRPGKT
jgi:hypothetical protein